MTLARPALIPCVLLLVLLGYGWAHWDRALAARGVSVLPIVLLAWAVLHVGTMWLNAALDRDEGEVLLGKVVPVPQSAERLGLITLIVGCLLGIWAGVGLVAVAVAVLSVLYSHPRFALKGHAVGGPLVNLLGYGLLTPLAGWSVVAVPPNTRTVVMWGLGCWGVLACYFAAQAFQQKEDRLRGYQTLVVTHGPVVTLSMARLSLWIACGGAVALAVVGWIPRVCLVLAGLIGWVDVYLQRWQEQPEGGNSIWARGLIARMLIGLSLSLTLVAGQFVLDIHSGGPVAGLATAGGYPADRPRLPPPVLHAWERVTGQIVTSGDTLSATLSERGDCEEPRPNQGASTTCP